ncbi:MAG: tetratricopeptide repeat protein [Bacteroidales bacterium]|nr:tetratricopeptide repeat protein [Muribaculaceae bacterium]MDY6413243.1 tetratricopeptide repeat protein [Bacteroidales bacterium]
MAKKKNQETRTKLEDINESLSGIEQKFEQHKKVIYWIVIAILIIALLVWGYFKFVYGPNYEKAKKDLSKADTELLIKNDSTAALKSYEKIAKNYSNPAGNRAKLSAATILYGQGDYKKALNYLEDYSPKGEIAGPASQALLGDCYVNNKNLDKAVSAYDKAIKLAGENKVLVASIMQKKANVLHSQKKYKEELDLYEQLETKYMGPGAMDAQIERAKTMMGGK